MLPGPAVPGSCLASFHFRWAIHPICPVQSLYKNTTLILMSTKPGEQPDVSPCSTYTGHGNLSVVNFCCSLFRVFPCTLFEWFECLAAQKLQPAPTGQTADSRNLALFFTKKNCSVGLSVENCQNVLWKKFGLADQMSYPVPVQCLSPKGLPIVPICRWNGYSHRQQVPTRTKDWRRFFWRLIFR